ncbi:hypothetical protein KP509_02G110400 [Ceratopteris richardii]|uniref:Uncharacterized protein n=1 Tax=Ceratopteris richardii TaxID=49495 RepID=A0A8T2VCU3_CERRI|nr:hypothetical protein KP509_02G110400 [Ceratopteris richardii]
MEAFLVSVLPMALKAAIQLGVLDILQAAETSKDGDDNRLSAMEIAARVQGRTTSLEESASSLNRILRVLANHGLLSASSAEELMTSFVAYSYGLSLSSRFFANRDLLASLSHFVLLTLEPANQYAYSKLEEAVLHGDSPFAIAHGTTFYSFTQQNHAYNQVFQNAMSGHSQLFMTKLLDTYEGLQTIRSLVDVGGGYGDCLRAITSRYPHLKGINLELPHIVANAPAYPGVEHVVGDMFLEIPNADAILIKWVLHNYKDDDCLKVLKNCHKSLPLHGKIIIIESLLPNTTENIPSDRISLYVDLVMLAILGGKSRTQEEFENLSIRAGFTKVELVHTIYGMSILEISK